MRDHIRSYLTRGVLLAAACLVIPIAQAASDTQATPPPDAPRTAPATVPQKPDDRQARWRADHRAFFEARLAALHVGLQLKPDQESLWGPVETAIRGFATLRADRWAAMKVEAASGKGDGALDRLRHQSERLIARGQAMKTLADAAAPLVASLDATQKDRLPRLLEGLRPRRVLGEALHGDDRDGGDREGGRGMRRERMERFGMRGHDGMDRDDSGREGGERSWGRRGGQAERDGMRDDRHDDGDMSMHRHHRHDDEGPDRT